MTIRAFCLRVKIIVNSHEKKVGTCIKDVNACGVFIHKKNVYVEITTHKNNSQKRLSSDII